MSLQKRIKLIDSLRGLAALIVVEHHIVSLDSEKLKSFTAPTLFEILNWLSNKNVEAVLFFFIVSGFSIGLSLAKNPITDKNSVNEYLYRRAKRILPIYWLAISIALISLFLFPAIYNASFSFYNLLGNLIFLQTPNIAGAWFIPYGNNGPLWSLSYEFYFYLLAIPVLIFKRKFSISPSKLTLVFFMVSLIMIGFSHKFPNPFTSFLTLFPIWLIGYELSHMYIHKKANKHYLIILASVFIISTFINRVYLMSSTLKVLNLGILISLVSCFGYALYHVKPLQSYLAIMINIFNKIFYKIGLASFSIYIFHYLVLRSLNQHHLFIQIAALSFLIICCYYFETWIVKKRFTFLKRKYV
ncbi:acyltransferase [Pedobacter sp.]|uniref:acyltransferase family protein n=1 Tax=Pedobacter sp. TaxID=1411316 RepID=UPI0031D3CD40